MNNKIKNNASTVNTLELSRRELLVGSGVAAAGLLASSLAQAGTAIVKRGVVDNSSAGSQIVKLSAMQLSAAIKNKTFSCEEVMQTYLQHITKLNPQFNALVSMREAGPLVEEARQCDAELAKGEYRGWLHGFPHAVKDLADAAGLVTSNGSPIFKNNIANKDSIHIARIKQAGAIIIGKTNVPEFGLGSQSYNPVFGPTLNAYDGKSTAGGSSGGAAAGLALQMLPVADGSDFMGSLRNPAAFNNIIGFRPTPGRVPLSNTFIEQLPCNGPMGRNVRDTAMLLSTMAGYDATTPTSLYQDTAQFAQPLEQDVKGIRIGWLGDFNGYLPMEAGVLQLCEKALQTFEGLGCHVDEVDLGYPMDKLWGTWLTFRHWLAGAKLKPLYDDPKLRPLLKPEAVWEVEGGAKLTADDIAAASQARAEWYSNLLGAFQKYDFLVLPTAQVFPFDAQIHWPKEIAGKAMDTYHRWMEVVVPGTLSGCPVINVPAGFGKQDLPMGLQIIGARHMDLAVLKIAYAYEQAAQWNSKYLPPILSASR